MQRGLRPVGHSNVNNDLDSDELSAATNSGRADSGRRFSTPIAELMSSNPVAKTTGVIRLLRDALKSDAIAITSVDGPTANTRVLGAVGYDAIMLDFLSSPRLANWHCIHYQLKHDSNALSWEELPLLYESSIVNEILIPLGYRNGIALPLRGNSGQLVGWAHTSSSRYKFDSEGRAELMRTRSILATLVQSEAKIWQLTPREREILALIRAGLPNPEIADRLLIANRTVGTHIENLLRKLALSNRVQAAVWAFDHGI